MEYQVLQNTSCIRDIAAHPVMWWPNQLVFTQWSLHTEATVPPRLQDFFPDISQYYLLPFFPRWADPLESEPIRDTQCLVTTTVCGCGADSLCAPGPALQAKCHKGWSHHSLWHCGLAYQAAECLWRICLNTGNLGLGKVILPEKDSLQNLCKCANNSVNTDERSPCIQRSSGQQVLVTLGLRAVEQACKCNCFFFFRTQWLPCRPWLSMQHWPTAQRGLQKWGWGPRKALGGSSKSPTRTDFWCRRWHWQKSQESSQFRPMAAAVSLPG